MPTHRTTHKLSRPPGDHMASRRARSKFASLNIRFALVLPTVACGARHSGAVGGGGSRFETSHTPHHPPGWMILWASGMLGASNKKVELLWHRNRRHERVRSSTQIKCALVCAGFRVGFEGLGDRTRVAADGCGHHW